MTCDGQGPAAAQLRIASSFPPSSKEDFFVCGQSTTVTRNAIGGNVVSREFIPALQRGRQDLAALLLALFLLYVLGLDQGFILSLVQGDFAFDQNLIHEAVHDARHAAGFPCH